MARRFCGIGQSGNKFVSNIGALRRSATCLGADLIFTVGKPNVKTSEDTLNAALHIETPSYDHFGLLIKDARRRNAEIVAIEITDDAIPLAEFTHPERAFYVLGHESSIGVPPQVLDKCDHVVQIDSKFCLNVSVAGAIVLYDRQTKLTLKPILL